MPGGSRTRHYSSFPHPNPTLPPPCPRTLSCTLALLSSLSRMNCLATALWPVARCRSMLTLPYRPVPGGRAFVEGRRYVRWGTSASSAGSAALYWEQAFAPAWRQTGSDLNAPGSASHGQTVPSGDCEALRQNTTTPLHRSTPASMQTSLNAHHVTTDSCTHSGPPTHDRALHHAGRHRWRPGGR